MKHWQAYQETSDEVFWAWLGVRLLFAYPSKWYASITLSLMNCSSRYCGTCPYSFALDALSGHSNNAGHFKCGRMLNFWSVVPSKFDCISHLRVDFGCPGEIAY
eukprot:2343490-Pleurochrysis_carterae.AAC.1